MEQLEEKKKAKQHNMAVKVKYPVKGHAQSTQQEVKKRENKSN